MVSFSSFSLCDARGSGGTVLRGLVQGVMRQGKFFGDNEDGSLQLLIGTGRKAVQHSVPLKDVVVVEQGVPKKT